MALSIFYQRTFPGSSSRSTRGTPSDNPFDDCHEVSMERISSSKGSSTGFPDSSAPDRADRILEDIRNGNQKCSVCMEAVLATRSMWHCRTCHNVLHDQCAKSWSVASGARAFCSSIFSWKCPHCMTIIEGNPSSSCWCGKGSPDFSSNNLIPNSCKQPCNAKEYCSHGNSVNCNKICHPGPCEHECTSICASSIPESAKTFWKKLKRFSRPEYRDERNKSLFGCMLLLVFYICLTILYVYHIKWHTQPYNYPKFADSYETAETFILCLSGALYLALMIPVGLFIFGVLSFFQKVWNSNTPASFTNSSSRGKLIRLIVFLVWVALVVLPVVGFAGGPDIVWYNQMKHSCDGFNSRVHMDRHSGSSSSYVEAKHYKIRNLDHSADDQSFYLASWFLPETHSNASWQYWHRFSGKLSSSNYISVDVDVDNKEWRLMELDGEDKETEWASVGRLTNEKMPTFQDVYGYHISNGTFEKYGSHVLIPELDFGISGIYDALKHCELEPFVRVFNIGNTSSEQLRQRMDSKWSNKFDENIVMRTASFGHGRQRLDMCIKNAAFDDSVSGVDESLIVPLAIISAMRTRQAEMSGRSCGSKIRHAPDEL